MLSVMVDIMRRNSSQLRGRSIMLFFSHGGKKVEVLGNYVCSTAFFPSLQRKPLLKIFCFTAPLQRYLLVTKFMHGLTIGK